MKIDTQYFGEMEIDEDKIIVFEEGLLGLEDFKKFVLVKDEELVIEYLQCIDKDVTFPIINPFLIKKDYEFKIPQSIIDSLDIREQNDVLVYTVVVIAENVESIRTNLQGPLVINTKNGKAKQIILDDKYPLKYMIYDKVGV